MKHPVETSRLGRGSLDAPSVGGTTGRVATLGRTGTPSTRRSSLQRMPTESTEKKAHRILTESRLTIDRVHGGVIVAQCRGFSDGEVYLLGYDPRAGGEWRCTCEASAKFNRRCAHLIALQLVTTRPAHEQREQS